MPCCQIHSRRVQRAFAFCMMWPVFWRYGHSLEHAKGSFKRFNLRLMKQSPGSLHLSVSCAGPFTVFFPPKAYPGLVLRKTMQTAEETHWHTYTQFPSITQCPYCFVQNCKARLANSDLPMRCFDTKNMWRHSACMD